MAWRLGLDLGSNSLGWAALELAEDSGVLVPCGLVDCGVRIFSDGRNPKDKQSNAAKRREPRAARKNRDRTERRQARLIRQLIAHGLFPEDPAARKALEGGASTPLQDSDPWILRCRALDSPLNPHQIGRAIFHLHQRRGFKSNRKADRGISDSGMIHEATKRTLERLKAEGARTLGELFGRPRLEALEHNSKAERGKRKPQPLARVRKSGTGSQAQYDYYPTRTLVLEEFDRIWGAQKSHSPEAFADTAWAELRDTIEWQHPLKPQPVGRCTLLPNEERAPKALPSFQRARIYQEVNALRTAPVGAPSQGLTTSQRNKIAERLLRPSNKTGRVTFDQIRKLKGIELYDPFNTETDKRKHLDGDLTAARLIQGDRWGPSWLDLPLIEQDEIVLRLLEDEDENILLDWLCTRHGIERDKAIRVVDCPLPDGHGNLSKAAIDHILPELEQAVVPYSEAVQLAGLGSHSQLGTGEVFDEGLPYYGMALERSVAFGSGKPDDPDEIRYGKIANPTVHVALNQVRAVVNDLIRRFGAPDQVVLELARDLPLSAKGKTELEAQQKKNQDANDRLRHRLASEFSPPIEDSYENRLRLRLYDELDALGKRCVFSGRQIGLSELFTDQIEIEHILPFSRTLDDSLSNKTLCVRQANRDKGNRTPFEAFGTSPAGYDWEDLSARAADLPPGKIWRFSPDAMNRFEAEESGFLARQLGDTRYISRIAKAYLETLYGGSGHKGGENHVWVVTGRLTADLRWTWGLDSVLRGHNDQASANQKKNRNDHRHHAIDAIVCACTDRRILQAASSAAAKSEQEHTRRLLADTPDPWPGFRDEVAETVRKMIVSHKPDHGIQGAMHNDTAYGLVQGPNGVPDKKGIRPVVTRKPLDSDAFKTPESLEKIRDPALRLALLEATVGLTGAEFKARLLEVSSAMKPPVYKVRIEERMNVITFSDDSGKPYKAYKGDGNYCYDIWADSKSKWTGEVISTFEAYQLARTDPQWWRTKIGRKGQPLILRLRKGDYLEFEHEGRRLIAQVAKFTTGKISLAEHLEANVDARTRDAKDDLAYITKAPGVLQKLNTHQVTVSPSGRVKIHN
ncbi:type II CRISPR RNA-guided endonuclease Cas9 [Roseibium sp. CAU 1637]|uniref:CRISPR-associated endonuclease Cas9 n=1 Tax=Roseibium limicola TaxID=2816037 RepID=A0A939EPP4_9HYPH|nr:type II CRISPR RNA-guided endonuclease Cas9 [Roseibium limicola]MBO0346035.1 type II CRISPR RNA-guided endonuclease Cas9 [Roseibium limicola]